MKFDNNNRQNESSESYCDETVQIEQKTQGGQGSGLANQYELLNNNRVELCGTISSQPIYSHELFGEGFYETSISVPRLSEYNDIIPVTISERLLTENKIAAGSKVCLKGQFRSYNKIEGAKSRLMLTVFVREVCEADDSINPNIIEIAGYLCKKPNYRTTPFSREICDLLLAVNRAYNKSDYIPCIAWGRNARFVANAGVGERIFVSGRIQSREYEKKFDDGTVIVKTAYEVSINKVGLEGLVAETLLETNEISAKTVTQVLADENKQQNDSESQAN